MQVRIDTASDPMFKRYCFVRASSVKPYRRAYQRLLDELSARRSFARFYTLLACLSEAARSLSGSQLTFPWKKPKPLRQTKAFREPTSSAQSETRAFAAGKEHSSNTSV